MEFTATPLPLSEKHGDEASILELYGFYTMPRLHKEIPIRVEIEGSKHPEKKKEGAKPPNFGGKDGRTPKDLQHVCHLGVHERAGHQAQRHRPKQRGARRNIQKRQEVVLLDAASWTPQRPGPLKNLDEVSGCKDILNRHGAVKKVIQEFLQSNGMGHPCPQRGRGIGHRDVEIPCETKGDHHQPLYLDHQVNPQEGKEVTFSPYSKTLIGE